MPSTGSGIEQQTFEPEVETEADSESTYSTGSGIEQQAFELNT